MGKDAVTQTVWPVCLAHEKASHGGFIQIMDLPAPLLPGTHKLADKFGVLKF